MSQIIDLPSAAPSTASPPLPHRLVALSRLIAALFSCFRVVAVAQVLAAAIVTVFLSDHVRIGAKGVYLVIGHPPAVPGTILYSAQPLYTRIAGIIDVAIATAPILFILGELHGLFSLYARGIVFARENASRLKRAGIWLVLYPFAKVIANMEFRLAGGTDKAWFSMDLVYSLVLGLVVLAIALVMEFGREIEQERSSFV